MGFGASLSRAAATDSARSLRLVASSASSSNAEPLAPALRLVCVLRVPFSTANVSRCSLLRSAGHVGGRSDRASSIGSLPSCTYGPRSVRLRALCSGRSAALRRSSRKWRLAATKVSRPLGTRERCRASVRRRSRSHALRRSVRDDARRSRATSLARPLALRRRQLALRTRGLLRDEPVRTLDALVEDRFASRTSPHALDAVGKASSSAPRAVAARGPSSGLVRIRRGRRRSMFFLVRRVISSVELRGRPRALAQCRSSLRD